MKMDLSMKTDSKTISFRILKLFSIIGFIPQPKTVCRKAVHISFAAIFLAFSIGLICVYYYITSFETCIQLLLNMYGDSAIISVGVACLFLNYRLQNKFPHIMKDKNVPLPSYKIILLFNSVSAISVVIGFAASQVKSFTVMALLPLGMSLNFGISLFMVVSYLLFIGCIVSNMERQVLMTCELQQSQVDDHLEHLKLELFNYRKLKDSTSFGFFLIITTQEHK